MTELIMAKGDPCTPSMKEDRFCQYGLAYYWAVTTLTSVGYGDIVAQNKVEYVVVAMGVAVGRGGRLGWRPPSVCFSCPDWAEPGPKFGRARRKFGHRPQPLPMWPGPQACSSSATLGPSSWRRSSPSCRA